MGWANHRAIRLVDLAALTFRTASEHNCARRRVECVALFWLHRSTGSLSRLKTQKKSRGGMPRNNSKD